eukprot:344076_1
MGLVDFNPVHGSGSGASDSELDDQYNLQQEILKARRDHVNFNSLHQKYSAEKQDLDVFALGKEHSPDKYQDSYVNSEELEKEEKGFQFPWNLKP